MLAHTCKRAFSDLLETTYIGIHHCNCNKECASCMHAYIHTYMQGDDGGAPKGPIVRKQKVAAADPEQRTSPILRSSRAQVYIFTFMHANSCKIIHGNWIFCVHRTMHIRIHAQTWMCRLPVLMIHACVDCLCWCMQMPILHTLGPQIYRYKFYTCSAKVSCSRDRWHVFIPLFRITVHNYQQSCALILSSVICIQSSKPSIHATSFYQSKRAYFPPRRPATFGGTMISIPIVTARLVNAAALHGQQYHHLTMVLAPRIHRGNLRLITTEMRMSAPSPHHPLPSPSLTRIRRQGQAARATARPATMMMMIKIIGIATTSVRLTLTPHAWQISQIGRELDSRNHVIVSMGNPTRSVARSSTICLVYRRQTHPSTLHEHTDATPRQQVMTVMVRTRLMETEGNPRTGAGARESRTCAIELQQLLRRHPRMQPRLTIPSFPRPLHTVSSYLVYLHICLFSSSIWFLTVYINGYSGTCAVLFLSCRVNTHLHVYMHVI
jgi:hypothetical protein